jgi:hypothetical protein
MLLHRQLRMRAHFAALVVRQVHLMGLQAFMQSSHADPV